MFRSRVGCTIYDILCSNDPVAFCVPHSISSGESSESEQFPRNFRKQLTNSQNHTGADRSSRPEPEHQIASRASRMLTDSATTVELPTPPPLPVPSANRAGVVVTDEIGFQDSGALLGPFPIPWRHPIKCALWMIRGLFGVVSLVLLLAVVAAVPVLNFVALGYMLEAEGSVARTGRLRSANPLFRIAPRIGTIALGIFLWLIPLQLLAGQVADAAIIDPTGIAVARLTRIKFVVAAMIAMHLCMALARGGSLGCFFRPVKNFRWLRQRFKSGNYWDQANGHIVQFIGELRLRHHFMLGLKGFAGALIWLAIPTALYAFYDVPKRDTPGAVFVTVIGGLMLVAAFAWVPFLQARLAAENRFRAMFELRAIRRAYRRTPLSWLLAVVLVYALSLPLYIAKVRLLPQDAMWVMTAVFIVTIYPARIVTGWVYHRSMMKQVEASFVWRWLTRLTMIPLLGLYVFLIFFSQAIGEHGKASLFEHHALLLPVPF